MAYNIFKGLDTGSDIATLKGTEVTTGLWSNDTGSLSAVYTSSNQVAISGEYYYDLYNGSNIASSDVQFSVAYGHVSGGGSPPLTTLNTSTLPTQVIYSQYRNILLTSDTSRFSFGSNASDDIYVINIQRSRLKQSIDPGNWQLGLSGSRGIRTFIDDSGLGTAVVGNVAANSVYNIRSGSLDAGLVSSDTTIYGTVFPDYGTIVLYPNAISSSVGFYPPTINAKTTASIGGNVPFAPYTGSNVTAYQYQHEGLLRSISASMAAGSPFIARYCGNYNIYQLLH